MKEEQTQKYIYKGATHDGRLISLPTEAGTIRALEEAGGGVYENTLHRFKFKV